MKFIAHRGLDKHEFYENTKEALIKSLNKDYIDGKSWYWPRNGMLRSILGCNPDGMALLPLIGK